MEGGITTKTKSIALLMGAVLILCAVGPSVHAQDAAPASVTLFRNVRIFDGKSSQLSPPSNVLVRGNKIERISATAVPTDLGADAVLIEGGGRTLMPGLIDDHWHTMLVRGTPADLKTNDI